MSRFASFAGRIAREAGVRARRLLAGTFVVAAFGAAGFSGHRELGRNGDDGNGRGAASPGAATIAQAPAPSLGEQARTSEATDFQEKVFSHVAGRMRNYDPSVSARVAETVLAESAAAGVEPLLVLAVIHVESTFKPDAKSDHGAVGLMQLKQRTMRDVLERAGLPVLDPNDPVENVRAGVRYLGHLLTAFRNLDTALMAYNAGPTRIRGHLRAGKIPNRYHAYPQKVRTELVKLRDALGTVDAAGSVAAAVMDTSRS